MPRRGGIIGVRGIWNNRWFNHDCFALSGRGLLWRRFPRALPGAGVFCPCGAGACARSEGAQHGCPGQSAAPPWDTGARHEKPRRGATPRGVCEDRWSNKGCFALSGRGLLRRWFPRALPGAGVFCPCGACASVRSEGAQHGSPGQSAAPPRGHRSKTGEAPSGRNTARCLREPFVQPRLFCPFRARVVMASVSPGVARGWCVLPLRGMRVRALRRSATWQPRAERSAALGRGKKTREAP